MADVTIRGPDCEEEEERGHRGRRGRLGPTGPTGSGGGGGGSTGPTGPGGTGPTGPTGAGGSGSTGNLQSFRYVVTGAEPNLSDFMVTLPAPRVNDVYRITYGLAGVAVIVGLDFPDLLAADRTAADFRVIATAPMQAGDQIDFHVIDPVP